MMRPRGTRRRGQARVTAHPHARRWARVRVGASIGKRIQLGLPPGQDHEQTSLPPSLASPRHRGRLGSNGVFPVLTHRTKHLRRATSIDAPPARARRTAAPSAATSRSPRPREVRAPRRSRLGNTSWARRARPRTADRLAGRRTCSPIAGAGSAPRVRPQRRLPRETPRVRSRLPLTPTLLGLPTSSELCVRAGTHDSKLLVPRRS